MPEKLVKFLEFVRAGEADSTRDYQDSFIRKIQKSMEDIRSSREMEEKFMLLEELLKDERAAVSYTHLSSCTGKIFLKNITWKYLRHGMIFWISAGL